MADAPPMSLARAQDALCDEARLFHNEMVRNGMTEMTPAAWLRLFRDWLDPWAFEQRHTEALNA